MFILVLWDHGFDFAINQENKEMKVIAAKIIIFYLLMLIKFIASSHLRMLIFRANYDPDIKFIRN
jgi:cation transporter-like permease